MSVQGKYEETKLSQDDPMSRRQERIARRAERGASRHAGGLGWLAGLILIAIGVLYLLNVLGILPEMTNWWALFLLLPAAGLLSAALGAFRRDGGSWTPAMVGPLLGSMLLAGLSAAFLFDFDYGWLWPLFLIAGGLLLLVGPFLSRASG
jgi:hypothetical protein